MTEIEGLMKYEVAGDPITGLKWTRRTTRKIAGQLKTMGITVSKNTVGRLLKQMNFSLRVNHKKLAACSKQYRDEQFTYIQELREQFDQEGNPVISVDTKKKELVGKFKNPGRAWNRQPLIVKDHDFRSTSEGIAIPYGVYDVRANRGSVFVGISHDTSAFAVESIEKWWRYEGSKRYPNADQILFLADGGGSNRSTSRVWKTALQEKLCDRHNLSVTVSHYPPGTSKWNPIEHRLFSEISKNWAGRPLENYETILSYIKSTTTSTGLKVKAYLVKKDYPNGVKVSDQLMDQLRIKKHETLPKLNYTLSSRKNGK